MLPLASCSLQKIVKQIKEAIAINRNGNASDNIIDVKRTLREMKILITPAIVSFLIFFLLFSPAIDIVVDLLFVVRDMSNPNVFKFIASKYYVIFGSLKQNQRAPLLPFGEVVKDAQALTVLNQLVEQHFPMKNY
ncbi:hypothetical protein L1887_05189 [Cichorium endivia]|nr:hypothetical protein L1887_05189 [Cichorium endivia]